MPYQPNPIPHREPFSGEGGLYPSSEIPCEYFRNYGGEEAPPPMADEERRMRNRPLPILSIYNILLGTLCVFILAISILLVTVSTNTIDDNTLMRTFDETYAVDNPGVPFSETMGVATHLSGVVVETYVGGAWIPVAGPEVSYSDTTGILDVTIAGIAGGSSLHITGDNYLSSPPVMSTFSVLGASLLILSIFSIICMLWWKNN